MRRIVVAAGTALAIALIGTGAGYAAWKQTDAELAKGHVRELLVDPESAVFSDVKVCDDGSGGRFVSGEVNSRNSNGGMTGKKTFVVQGVDLTPLASVAGKRSSFVSFADSYLEAYVTGPFDATCTQAYKTAISLYEERLSAQQPLASTEGMETSIDNMAEIDRILNGS